MWVVCGLGVLEEHPASKEAQLSAAKVRTGPDKRNQGKVGEAGGRGSGSVGREPGKADQGEKWMGILVSFPSL